MKKLLLSLSLSALMAGSAMATPIQNGNGMLNISANVFERTCQLNVADRGQVRFGDIWFDDFSNTKKTVNFEVTECSVKTGAKVKLTFNPASSTVVDGKLINIMNGSAKAEGVVAVVKDANDKNVLANNYTAAGVNEFDLSGQLGTKVSKTFTYTIELEKASNATAGTFNAMLPYTVAYE